MFLDFGFFWYYTTMVFVFTKQQNTLIRSHKDFSPFTVGKHSFIVLSYFTP